MESRNQKKNPLTDLQITPHLLGIVVQLQQIVADVGLEHRVPLFTREGARQPLKCTDEAG